MIRTTLVKRKIALSTWRIPSPSILVRIWKQRMRNQRVTWRNMGLKRRMKSHSNQTMRNRKKKSMMTRI